MGSSASIFSGVWEMKKFLALAMAGAAMVAVSGQANAAELLFNATNVTSVYKTKVPTAELHKTNSSAYLPADSNVGDVLVTPQTLTGSFSDAPGTTVNLFAYCVDIFDTSGATTFQVVSLSDYLTGLGIGSRYGVIASLISSNSSTAGNDKLHDAAVQLAIWELINESSTNAFNVNFTGSTRNPTPQFWADDFANANGIASTANSLIQSAIATASSTNPSLNLYIAKSDDVYRTEQYQECSGYGKHKNCVTKTRQVLVSTGKQDMLFWDYDVPTPAVPEPATWAMMILGMGVIGSSMRRRKIDVSFA